jgi:hypothetical protein
VNVHGNNTEQFSYTIILALRVSGCFGLSPEIVTESKGDACSNRRCCRHVWSGRYCILVCQHELLLTSSVVAVSVTTTWLCRNYVLSAEQHFWCHIHGSLGHNGQQGLPVSGGANLCLCCKILGLICWTPQQQVV